MSINKPTSLDFYFRGDVGCFVVNTPKETPFEYKAMEALKSAADPSWAGLITKTAFYVDQKLPNFNGFVVLIPENLEKTVIDFKNHTTSTRYDVLETYNKIQVAATKAFGQRIPHDPHFETGLLQAYQTLPEAFEDNAFVLSLEKPSAYQTSTTSTSTTTTTTTASTTTIMPTPKSSSQPVVSIQQPSSSERKVENLTRYITYNFNRAQQQSCFIIQTSTADQVIPHFEKCGFAVRKPTTVDCDELELDSSFQGILVFTATESNPKDAYMSIQTIAEEKEVFGKQIEPHSGFKRTAQLWSGKILPSGGGVNSDNPLLRRVLDTLSISKNEPLISTGFNSNKPSFEPFSVGNTPLVRIDKGTNSDNPLLNMNNQPTKQVNPLLAGGTNSNNPLLNINNQPTKQANPLLAGGSTTKPNPLLNINNQPRNQVNPLLAGGTNSTNPLLNTNNQPRSQVNPLLAGGSTSNSNNPLLNINNQPRNQVNPLLAGGTNSTNPLLNMNNQPRSQVNPLLRDGSTSNKPSTNPKDRSSKK